ncbi:MAG: hypothetical protein K2L19_04650 [Eubacterium sp.]|nr:hypothetical protein [Eubacterium sp.]
MSKSVRYFALKEDIMEVIHYIDSEFEFKYVKNGVVIQKKTFPYIILYQSMNI